jgi:hypothetical protein
MGVTGALLLGLMLAQAAPVEAGEAAQIERIRKALERLAAIETMRAPDRDDRPVFRVTVKGWKIKRPLWQDDSVVPLYVRPTMPPTHFEFQQQVTTEFFRSSVLYPGFAHTPYGTVALGIPVVPLVEALAKATKAFSRKLAEQAAREEVRQALEELLACRPDPAKPGC